MPFTVSHAAVAAPLARRGFVFSALVVGSMAPDFEYFLRLNTSSHWGHTWPGVVWLSFPVALVTLWAFHRFLKRPFLHLLPSAHRRHLESYGGPFAFLPASRFARLVVSLWVGMLTHLALDNCTHDYGLVVQWWPWLRTPVLHYGAQAVPVHDLLQIVFTAGLSLMLVRQYWRSFRDEQAPSAGRLTLFLDCRDVLPVYLGLAVLALAVGALYASLTVPFIHDYRTFRQFAGRAVVGGLDVALVAAIVMGEYLQRKRLVPLRARREGPS